MKSYSYANGKFDRTIVVGDVHGCYIEFQELLKTPFEQISVRLSDALMAQGCQILRSLNNMAKRKP
jgi:hypothetical protein